MQSKLNHRQKRGVKKEAAPTETNALNTLVPSKRTSRNNKVLPELLLPTDVAELRIRQSVLLDKLEEALEKKDPQLLYWINAEIMTICHIFGIQSPIPGALGVETLKGLRDMNSLVVPTDVAGDGQEALKRALLQSLTEAEELRADEAEEL